MAPSSDPTQDDLLRKCVSKALLVGCSGEKAIRNNDVGAKAVRKVQPPNQSPFWTRAVDINDLRRRQKLLEKKYIREGSQRAADSKEVGRKDQFFDLSRSVERRRIPNAFHNVVQRRVTAYRRSASGVHSALLSNRMGESAIK